MVACAAEVKVAESAPAFFCRYEEHHLGVFPHFLLNKAVAGELVHKLIRKCLAEETGRANCLQVLLESLGILSLFVESMAHLLVAINPFFVHVSEFAEAVESQPPIMSLNRKFCLATRIVKRRLSGHKLETLLSQNVQPLR